MANFAINLPIILWIIWTFIVGTCVGSLLNVCIARLPLEKSILWPSSRCGNCLQPIRWYDNIPLLSYWLLRGRCRRCGARFSIRYFLIELGTGLGFAGLFYVEIVANIHDLAFFKNHQWTINAGSPPWQAWAFFAHHAALLSLLIIAAVCDLNGRVIPLSATLFGTGLGLIGAVLFPWPWPDNMGMPNVVPPAGVDWWAAKPGELGRGLYPWPLWGPLPPWMPPGGYLSGLMTGVAGVLVGTWMLRGVRTVFSRGLGQEALGLGDADLMMMAGAFLGWQPVVVAFFVGAIVTLGFAIAQLIINKDKSLPFGPGLAAGIVITWLCWRWIGPAVQPLLFHELLLAICVGLGLGFMFVASALLGMLPRRRGEGSA
jgi:leader peptidase (prepilin peptidase)/N-methyltransferase